MNVVSLVFVWFLLVLQWLWWYLLDFCWFYTGVGCICMVLMVLQWFCWYLLDACWFYNGVVGICLMFVRFAIVCICIGFIDFTMVLLAFARCLLVVQWFCWYLYGFYWVYNGFVSCCWIVVGFAMVLGLQWLLLVFV